VKVSPTVKQIMNLVGSGVEPTSQGQWFHSPPKVHIVTRILGARPACGTRGGDADRGDREVGGDSELVHRESFSPPLPMVSTARSSLSPILNLSSHTTKLVLTKFVCHIWRGSSVRSYATTVRAESAPMVPVTMSHGGGH
jgi:hypothetical protein